MTTPVVPTSGRRLVMVSNRLPFTVSAEGRQVEFRPSSGGLVTGLAAFRASSQDVAIIPADHVWVGWPGASVDPRLRGEVIREARERFQSYPVFLSEGEMEEFYLGFCNATIWPLFHYFPSYAVYRPSYWDQYQKVNQKFADALQPILEPGDLLWVHDYHLMLLPRLLKELNPQLSVGFFLHIPFPSFEIYRMLPTEWRREILLGILGADLIGFHTYEYARHFLHSVLRILGYDHRMGRVATADRFVRVDTFPMGIAYERFAGAAAGEETRRQVEELTAALAGSRLILTVDRLDYSKGILNRLEGYELFLETRPQYHGRVVLVMVVVPSRIGVRQYGLMKRSLDELVGKINGRFGRVDWTPVVYQYREVPFASIVALYAAADVCLVTPLRDGMNLVAKEYLAARGDRGGVLVLSEMAGAARELPEAILVNPNNRVEIAGALEEALEMSFAEQQHRTRRMQNRLRRYDASRWAADFLWTLADAHGGAERPGTRLISADDIRAVVRRYQASSRRLLFLDYDGTLSPFASHPAKAEPADRLIELLGALSSDPRNSVVLASGRDRPTGGALFRRLPIGLVAEHGAWLRPTGRAWERAKPAAESWKELLLPILEVYADRLPGAFVEDKEESVAWHYRLADPEQADLRASELIDHLRSIVAKTDLQVVQGKRVVEVRRAGADKGSALLAWAKVADYDFVLGIGDDTTDEDLFDAMPESGVSIHVGVSATRARYCVRGTDDVIALLATFAAAAQPR